MKITSYLLKLIAFSFLFQVGSVNAATAPQLRIESAVVVGETIVIDGLFDDSVVVTLYDTALTCIATGITLLECDVPDLDPGTYRLEVFNESVNNGNSVVTTDGSVKPTQFYGTLDVTLGTTGPKGPQGLQGEAGTDGLNGVNGTNGTDGSDGSTGIQGDTGPQGLPGEPRSGCVLVPHGTYYEEITVEPSPMVSGLLLYLGNARHAGISCNPVIPGGSCYQEDLLDFKFDCGGHTWVQASAFSKADGKVDATFTNLGQSGVVCGFRLTWYGVECR